MEFFNYVELDKIKCVKCNNSNLHDENDDDYIFFCSEGERMIICEDCTTYYFPCPDCNVERKVQWRSSDKSEHRIEELYVYPLTLCQFIGYEFVNSYDTEYDPEDSDEDIIRTIINKNENALIFNFTLERLEFEHSKTTIISHRSKNQYYVCIPDINKSGESLTGPDGGGSHFWKCPECSKLFGMTDK